MDAKELGNQPAAPVQGQPFRDDNGAPRDPYGYGWSVDPHPGLTKRELFAAMAMQGLCADTGTAGMKLDALTAQSVELADSLLAELAKEQP